MDVGEFGMRPLAGGFSGETFLAESAGERTVVRIYAQRGSSRGAAAVEVDAAMLRLVRGLLPVPEVLEVRRPDPAAGTPALLVTSFLTGERLDLLLPRLDEDARRTVAARLGVVLGRLAQMPVLRPGFFVDGDLRVEPMAGGDLVEFVRGHRASTALAAWDAAAYDGLLAVADRAQTLLDRVDRVTVVHSDFNPKNLLVDPDTLEVTGVLDWEFAHAGLPVTDLGNLLRFERDAAFAEGVVAAFRASVPDAGADVLDLARAADLYALVDLAGRRGSHEVADRAHNLLYAIACTGDLHAWG
ncbi:MAG: phosphotransferase family protein [Nocardioidaceae bacterium]